MKKTKLPLLLSIIVFYMVPCSQSSIYLLLGLASLLFVSCDRHQEKVAYHAVETAEIDSFMTLTGLYGGFQLIPLENDARCMLSNVMKLVAIPEGFIIYDESGQSNVFFFDMHGKFKGKIGDVGKNKREYVSVDDIAVDTAKREISVLTRGREIKVYDYGGQHVRSIELKAEAYLNKMCRYEEGYVCLTNHSARGDSLLCIYDDAGQLIGKKIPSLPTDITDGSFVANPLQTFGHQVLFVDFFQSLFNILDVDDWEQTDTYMMQTGRMFTYDEKEFENHMDLYDCILSGYLSGEKVFGWMDCNKTLSYYEMDLATKKASILSYYDWAPPLLSFHDGHAYTILTQEEIFALAYPSPANSSPTMEALSKAFEPYRETYTMNSNFVILKMKQKCKDF